MFGYLIPSVYLCSVKITQEKNQITMQEQMFSYKYPHPAVATDCVIFGYDGLKLKVLLIVKNHSKGNGHFLADF